MTEGDRMTRVVFDDKKFYTPTRVAELLSVNRCTVYRMIRSIEEPLPAVRLKGNGQLRISGLELNKYLEEHEVDPLNE